MLDLLPHATRPNSAVSEIQEDFCLLDGRVKLVMWVQAVGFRITRARGK
jgi:hypothetical protein